MQESYSKNESQPGTIENPIIDSNLTREEALRPNPDFVLPAEVFERQILLPVIYLSFDGKFHRGQMVVDKDLEIDVREFFDFLLKKNFPVNKVVPIADKNFNFDDTKSMIENNSSAFNPRNKTGKNEPSNHAFGRAVDINPLQNPYKKGEITEPLGATYTLGQAGTLTIEIVDFLRKRGWIWGGDYENLKDYHHFEKLLEEIKK